MIITENINTASDQSLADRLVQIPEVQESICRHASLGPLACLARTSRDFFLYAIPPLWGKYACTVIHLLNLLPEEYDGLYGVRNLRVNFEQIVLVCPLPDADFARFRVYGPHVKNLDIPSCHFRTHSAILSYIKSHAHSLLPNLRSVSAPSDGLGIMPPNMDWAEPLASLPVESLDLFSYNATLTKRETAETLYRLVEKAVRTYPNLRYLALPCDFPMHGLCTTTPSSLVHLRLFTRSLNPVSLTWLRRIKTLRRLRLGCLREVEAPTKVLDFSQLRYLELQVCLVEAAITLLQSVRLDNMSCLRLVFSGGERWNNDGFSNFFQQCAQTCPSITELRFSYSLGFIAGLSPSDIPTPEFSLRNLNHFHSHALRKLSISGYWRAVLGEPEAVCELVEQWPSLRLLDLPDYGATIEDLRIMIPRCPQLSFLRLRIELNVVTGESDARSDLAPSPPGHGASRPLKLVSSSEHLLYSGELFGTNKYARSLVALRPRITFRLSHGENMYWYRGRRWVRSLNQTLRAMDRLRHDDVDQ